MGTVAKPPTGPQLHVDVAICSPVWGLPRLWRLGRGMGARSRRFDQAREKLMRHRGAGRVDTKRPARTHFPRLTSSPPRMCRRVDPRLGGALGGGLPCLEHLGPMGAIACPTAFVVRQRPATRQRDDGTTPTPWGLVVACGGVWDTLALPQVSKVTGAFSLSTAAAVLLRGFGGPPNRPSHKMLSDACALPRLEPRGAARLLRLVPLVRRCHGIGEWRIVASFDEARSGMGWPWCGCPVPREQVFRKR